MNKPQAKDYHTDTGLHAAMQSWARSKDRPSTVATITYADGSKLQFEFQPATKEVPYKTRDKEVYHQTVDTAKYNADWLICYAMEHQDPDSINVTHKRLRELLRDFLEYNNPDSDYAITWKKGEQQIE